MTAPTSLLSFMVTAAPDAEEGVPPPEPNLQDAIAMAYDWHQNAGGLYAFASNGGVVVDEVVRQQALAEVAQAEAWVQSRATDINSGSLPEFKADVEAAQQAGQNPSDYVLGRLANLKAALEQGFTAPVPTSPEAPAEITSSVEKEAKTVISVEVFNKARNIAQNMIQKVTDPQGELAGKLHKILYELNQIEVQSAGNLSAALDDQVDPDSAGHAKTLIQTLAMLQRGEGGSETPAMGGPAPAAPTEQAPAQVESSLTVKADFADDTIKAVVQFVRVNLDRFKQQLGTPEGTATVQQELAAQPGGQMAGAVVPLIQQLASGTLNENGFIAGLSHLFRQNRGGRVRAFLAEQKLITGTTRIKAAQDGSVHVCGLPKNASTLKLVMQFATTAGIKVKLVKAFTGPKKAAAEQPALGRSEELPFTEGGAAARVDETVFDDTRKGKIAADPALPAEDHVIKVGNQYLVVGNDPQELLSLTPKQAAASRFTHQLAQLWMNDDRLSRVVSAQGDGTEARIVRVVPKKMAAAKTALIPPAPSASGNHAGPANPVNPTGTPAPVAPAPTPATPPSTQGPAVTHTSPGSAPPPAPSAVAVPGVAPQTPGAPAPTPGLDAQGQPVQSSLNDDQQEIQITGYGTLAIGQIKRKVLQQAKDGIAQAEAGNWPQALYFFGSNGVFPELIKALNRERRTDMMKEGALKVASEGTLNGVLSEIEGNVSSLQELADTALAKARLLNDESLVAAAERMNTAIFEAGMAARHAKGLASGTKGEDKPADDEPEQKPGELKEASQVFAAHDYDHGCPICHQEGCYGDCLQGMGNHEVDPKYRDQQEEEANAVYAAWNAKQACSGEDCTGTCPNCKKKTGLKQAGDLCDECGIGCKPAKKEAKCSPGSIVVTNHTARCTDCGASAPEKGIMHHKEARAKTADDAEQSAMAREVVLDWVSTHPEQRPNFQDPTWKQLYEQNRTECPDENTFIEACQRAFGEMQKSIDKQGSLIVAALTIQARGLMGPCADTGDTVENAVKFIHGNAKDVEDETVAGLRQILADAGYNRTTAELAIEEVFGEEATLANGALLKTLLKSEVG